MPLHVQDDLPVILLHTNMSGVVYVLQLKDGNYYVGWSENVEDRIVAHFTGGGSEWTKKYAPEKVLDIREGGKLLEKLVTLEYMIKYGWEKTRGGPWTACDLKSPPVALRKSKEPPLCDSTFYEERKGSNAS